MDAIIEQIAREVMLKLKSESANRGSSYSPPAPGQMSISGGQGQVVGVLLTANFKVIGPVLRHLPEFLAPASRLIASSYLVENYRNQLAQAGVNVVHSGVMPVHEAIKGLRELQIPSLSISTLAKAANLIADTYAAQVISSALCEGIPITVFDESLLDASRYFPAGVARKVDNFRRDLESMGVRFQRGTVHITPEHKCAPCSSADCSACTTHAPAPTGTAFPAGSAAITPVYSATKPTTATAPTSDKATQSPPGACGTNPDGCSRAYGSCLTSCEQKVQEILEAGADRLEKGLNAPTPGPQLARYIDHTLLKANATNEEITALCQEARANNFASVCVNPGNVALAARLLAGSPVKVCTVIGFPLGATSTFAKVMETRDAIANGAQEIDMVINVGLLKSKDYETVRTDIARVVEAANGNCVKVILETSLLTDEEKVKACELAKQSGADFVKTSTGFSTGGATVKDICLMRCTVGPAMGVKASGGIRDTKTAQQMIAAGATRIGASASVAIVKGGGAATGKGY